MFHPNRSGRCRRLAFSLVELMVILGILAILASLIIPNFTSTAEYAAEQATRETMRQLQTTILDRYRLDTGTLPQPLATTLQPPSRMQHPQLLFLFVNPKTNDTQSSFDPIASWGWRGPYLFFGRGRYPDPASESAKNRGFTNQFGEAGDETILDGWNNPIVIQLLDAAPTYQLVSAGPDGDLKRTADNLTMILK